MNGSEMNDSEKLEWIVMSFCCSCGKSEVHVIPSWMDGVDCTNCGKFQGHNAQALRKQTPIPVYKNSAHDGEA